MKKTAADYQVKFKFVDALENIVEAKTAAINAIVRAAAERGALSKVSAK